MTGVDINKYCPVTFAEKQLIRRELGFPVNKKIVLHVGHINRARNLLPLTKLAKEDFFPVVIGSTTESADENIKQRLEAAGVLVIHRYLENIEKFYQAADCYVFPTVNPKYCVQIPLSVLEAMSCNLPVISTRFEGLPYVFPEGYMGITYVDDLDALPRFVCDVLSKPVRPRAGSITSFDWANIGLNLSQFYTKLLQNEKE